MAKNKKSLSKKSRIGPHWKSRIVGHGKADPKTLKANPLNWRMHPETQTRAMRAAFERLGVIEGVIVNKRTGHIVDGHMRCELAIENEEPLVDVIYIDISLEEEKLALSIINPMAELASTDPEKLAELLGGVKRQGGPLDELLASLEEQAVGAVMKEVREKESSGTSAHRTHVMRLMIENPDVAVIERAIAMTGLANRGEALLALCHSYLGKDSEEKPRRTEPQDSLESELAQAFDLPAGNLGKPRGNGKGVGAGVRPSPQGRRVRTRPAPGGDPVPPAPDVERLPGEGGSSP